MDRLAQTDAHVARPIYTCARCGRTISQGRAFAFRARSKGSDAEVEEGNSEVIKCFPCALRHRPMLRRSLTAALVVGAVLTLLNQGDTLLSGQWSSTFYWKIPLTFCVPLIVATYGALTNSRK